MAPVAFLWLNSDLERLAVSDCSTKPCSLTYLAVLALHSYFTPVLRPLGVTPDVVKRARRVVLDYSSAARSGIMLTQPRAVIVLDPNLSVS